jgi:putative colanic acid biosynthesis UDP-glucose lipid carrier transferase
VFLRTSFTVVTISVLEAVAPALIVLVTLLVLAWAQDAPYTPSMAGLALLSFALSVLLLKPSRHATAASLLSPLAIGMNLGLRWVAVLGILLAFGYVAGISDEFPRRVVLPWALVAPLLVFGTSVLLKTFLRRIALSRENVRSAVIVGFNDSSASLATRLLAHPELGIRLDGFFDDRGPERLGNLSGHRRIGPLAELTPYLRSHGIDVIFIALPIRHVQRVMDLLDELRDSTASIYFVPDIFVMDLIQSRTAEIGGMPVVAMCETPFYGHRAVMKRLVDLIFTTTILIPTLPVLLGIYVAIKATSRGPGIFRQRRYGLDGQEIVVFKFRTMFVTEDGPHVPQAKKNDPRITPIGRWLRRYSLDELPQLFNVLQGSMSLVGPRPHAVAHNEQYRRVIKGYMIRHKVLPGITGLAQVNGCRGETSEIEQMQARVKFDLDYLRHWSPLMDVKIIALTARQLLGDPKAH